MINLMLYIGGKKLRNRVKLSTKVKTCVPNLAVVRRFDCICHQKKFVIERTRDLIYFKFVATDFSPKIISPSAGENSCDSA